MALDIDPFSVAYHVGYSLPIDTMPPSDPDIATFQGWFYVMGPNQGPFWHWSQVAKQATRQAANQTGVTSALWHWQNGAQRWERVLTYRPGNDGPYMG